MTLRSWSAEVTLHFVDRWGARGSLRRSAANIRLRIKRSKQFGLKSSSNPSFQSILPSIHCWKMAAAGDCNGSTANFTEVVLVRHGETSWNASRILQVFPSRLFFANPFSVSLLFD
ncbi:hypothetical protein IEQ34_017990 [Dendrobium chrysotoxum]|uniref:Uncharacterized protein n=1 Tax=Dendrobium chrysotoxum TaxID=161865 RepID=A0AAV7GBT5_DENCH|nr:hypothetical protein IEQ34_017990 [Dendrobium chrysotoxum]